jgi:dihydrolipoamide dehydrogenase
MYDVFVIGGGPGGYTAALHAAKKGLRVAIAEKSSFGGVCTNKGCIPTKTYIESINLLNKIKNAKRFGIEVENPTLDMGSLNKRKDRVVTRLAKGIEYLLKENKVTIYSQEAIILSHGKVKVGEEIIEVASIIVATGSSPKIPDSMNIPGIWTSDDVFLLKSLPNSLAIVGGGVIGMEMAGIFSGLGVKVTVIEALETILATEDPEVAKEITKIYRDIDIITSAKVEAITGKGPFKIGIASPQGKKEIETQNILVCIGRKPNVPKELADMGIRLNDSGGISVDEYMKTSIAGIYAIGDVTGKYMYAYVAARQGEIAVKNIAGENASIDYSTIPSVIFTHPEVASVGASLAELAGKEYKTGLFPVSALGRARTMEANEGFAKVIADESGIIKRITIMGPHATELIAWCSLAISGKLTVHEFLHPMYPHPVMAELVKEAAEDILGFSVHK